MDSNNIFDIELKEPLREFVKKSIFLLENEIPFREPIEFPVVTRDKNSIQVITEYREKINYTLSVGHKWKTIRQQKEYISLRKKMEINKVISKFCNTTVGTNTWRTTNVIDLVLEEFLIRLFENSSKLNFNSRKFERCYVDFKKFFNESYFRMRSEVLLGSLKSDIKRIVLDKDLEIIKIPDNKIGKYVRLRSRDSKHFMTFEYLLRRTYDHKKIIGTDKGLLDDSPEVKTKEIFNDVISSMRLYRKGIVGYNTIYTEFISWTPFVGVAGTGGLYSYPHELGSYEISETDVSDIKKIYEKMKIRSSYLDVSIGRLNFASERERIEDKLIDYVIGLESLMIKGSNQEISFRVSLKTSFLIGKNKIDRKNIFNIIKKAYNIRSRIVHGSLFDKKKIEINGRDYSLKSFVNEIEEILRKAILKALDYNDHDKLLENIDEKILK